MLELVAALSVHDRQTRGHSERVRVFTDLISDEMKLAPGDRARLRWAALLHDIGKLVVPAEILSKPAKLTTAEMDDVRRHPDEGARLIGPLTPGSASGPAQWRSITNASTVAAIRAGWPAIRSRSPGASSRSPTRMR